MVVQRGSGKTRNDGNGNGNSLVILARSAVLVPSEVAVPFEFSYRSE